MTIFSDAEPVRVAQRSMAKDIGVKQPSERALNAMHCFSICEYLIFLKGQLSSLWINVSKRETASPVFKNELRISFVVNKVFLLLILWGYIENDRYSSWYTFCFHQPFSHLLMTGQYRYWIRPMPELVVTILCQIKVLICWVGVVVGIELQTVSLHLWYNKKYFILITFILPGSSLQSSIHSWGGGGEREGVRRGGRGEGGVGEVEPKNLFSCDYCLLTPTPLTPHFLGVLLLWNLTSSYSTSLEG